MAWIVLTQIEWEKLESDVSSIAQNVTALSAVLASLVQTNAAITATLAIILNNVSVADAQGSVIENGLAALAAALAEQKAGIDAADEVAVAKANADLTALTKSLQLGIAAISPNPNSNP